MERKEKWRERERSKTPKNLIRENAPLPRKDKLAVIMRRELILWIAESQDLYVFPSAFTALETGKMKSHRD